MPIPDALESNPTPPAESSNLGLRKFIHTIFGLVAAVAFFVAIWPSLFEAYLPGFRLERWGGAAPVRFIAAFAFMVALAIRLRSNPGKQPTRAAIAWAEFANSTGGTLFQKRRKPTQVGWEGGAAVRWESEGVAFVLSGYTDSSQKNHTRVASDLRLSQPLRFYALPRTFLTQAFASPQVWNVMLASQKAADQKRGTSGTDGAAAEQMAFMAEKEVLTGDPMIDAAVIVKSDNPAVARELFSDSGVAHWLRELNASRKGWQLNLIVKNLPDAYELSLTIPGLLIEAKELDAARQLMESAVSRLSDRGVLDGWTRKASGSAGS
jgi:hypothetical protein